MEDFIHAEGLPFLAHLMKRLSDGFVDGCTEWFPEFGITAPARTMSTLRALHLQGTLSVTELAKTIRQSHPMVINWLRLLEPLGFVHIETDPKDRRRSLVTLSEKGREEATRSLLADRRIALAYEQLMEEAKAHVHEALWRMEMACRDKPFAERLREAAGALESSQVVGRQPEAGRK